MLIERGRVLAVPSSDELPLTSPLRFSRSGNWRMPAQLAMPNLVVRSSGERTLQQLIGAVESGLLVRGRGSIVTNPGRTVFRVRPQVGWRIQGGEVKEMVRDFEIEMPVEAFWKQLVEIGSPRDTLLAGELFPERSYPLWTQPFSVSTPPALFAAVSVFSSKESA
jgi:predicted Zn-dependent protease